MIISDALAMANVNARHTVSQPFFQYTENDHSAIIAVSTIASSLLMLVTLAGKLFVRYNITRFQDFDFVLLAGALLVFVQSACILYAASRGLGKSRDILSLSDVDNVLSLQYGAALVSIIGVSCTKLSTCLLIKSINDNGRVALFNRCLMGLILASGVSGLFATAFQCPLPAPWSVESRGNCPGLVPIQTYDAVANVITDGLIVFLAISMMWSVQTTQTRKLLVVALFGARILCPLTTIPELHEIQNLHTSDATLGAAIIMVYSQMSRNLSVITACIPSMKVVFDNLLFDVGSNVEVPYELTAVAGTNVLQVKSLNVLNGSSKRSRGSSRNPMPGPGLKLSNAVPNEVSCYAADKPKKGFLMSESRENLTDGVVLVKEEVEIEFANDHRGTLSHSSRDTL